MSTLTAEQTAYWVKICPSDDAAARKNSGLSVCWCTSLGREVPNPYYR